MQETIKKVMEAEKKAAEIVAEAREKAADIINERNSEISEKLNKFRSEELKRFNEAVGNAEYEQKKAVERVRDTETGLSVDLNSIADRVAARIMKTVFD